MSDLLDDDGRMSDAATISLRCKRSPRRSSSARELLASKSEAAVSVPISCRNPGVSRNEKTSVSNNDSSTTPHGNRSAPPSYQPPNGSRFSYKANCVANAVALEEKQKCLPIYLSGVIDSIDSNQAVR